ncbi:MAG: BACON domain-containing protein [Bryobacteraceae bacterium]|nr:BACON domain-containing protein [Bryobacteraceae bacterium]
MSFGGTRPVLCLLLGVLALNAQTNRLSFRPVEAEYSNFLDRIIMISASPNVLHVYDPVARVDQTVSLGRAPLALSVSLDGRYAAVGHDGLISYVNLQTRVVDRTFTVTGSAQKLLLGADYVYVAGVSGGALSLVRISTGAVTQGANFNGAAFRLHPSGNSIYAVDSYYFSKYDLTVSSNQTKSVYLGYNLVCGRIWFSPDGGRIYNGCATVHRASTDAALDMTALVSFPGLSSLAGISESSVTGRVAVIPLLETGSSTDIAGQVRLYESGSLREIGRFRLPAFTVGSNSYAAHGRWVFLNSTGASMHVLVQADNTSGLLNDFAVQSFALANPAPCFASFNPGSVSIPASGSLAEIGISAAADCVYQAVSSVPWIQVVSGGFGSGDSTIRIHVRANTATGSRTSSVIMGTQTLTVTQAAAAAGSGVQQRLSYRVVDAEYSKALDRIVLVSAGPDELHLYDPVTRTGQFVPLAHTPLSVSVHPDGLRAAVGHNGFVSYVNLQTASVERVYAVPGTALDVVLGANGYAYVFGGSGYNAGPLHSVLLSSGAVTTVANLSAAPARLYSTGNYIYANASSYMTKWDIRQGVATLSSSTYSISTCGNLWLSEDGVRMFTGCGGVFRTSEVPQQDGVPNGSFVVGYGSTGVAWAAHSSSRASTAVLPGGAPSYYSTPVAGEVQLYADDGLILQGRLLLATYSDSAGVHQVQGKHVFWNRSADKLFVVSQVNASAALISDFVVETVTPAAIAGCAITLGSNAASVGASGGMLDIAINTGPGCIWDATASEHWLGLGIGGTRGTGSGTLRLNVQSNYPNTSARSAVVHISGRQFTVAQAASSGVSLSLSPVGFSHSGGSGYGTVYTNSSTRAWTAVAGASWITITNASGSGYGNFSFQVAANTGAARWAVITVGLESMTVTQSAAPGTPGTGMRFVGVTPCRLLDTRPGGSQLTGGVERGIRVAGNCGVSSSATAYSVNVTVVPLGPLGYLTLWPYGQSRPLVSTLNSLDGRVKANAAIVPAGDIGWISAYATNNSHLILDINGYFIPAAGANTSTSHPFNAVKPCRVADTRSAAGSNGGPSFTAGQSRTFSIRSVAGCDAIPTNVAAYSLNITAIPKSGALGYLTTWAAGGAQPFVSTLNSFTGTVVANAAIVPAGTNGDISVYVTDAADVVIDINGYFGPGGGTPLLYYPKTPCRISDTRGAFGSFGGPIAASGQARAWPVPNGSCGMPANASAYVLNATVVPSATLGYLTLWPSGAAQPLVSTLNSFDGSITANAAIVPAGVGGAVSSFVSNDTHLILDTTGYFAP